MKSEVEVGSGVGTAPLMLIWDNALPQFECSNYNTLLSCADSAFRVLHLNVNLGVLILA